MARTAIPWQDITKWKRKEATAMRTTLQRFIGLIKFSNISSYDFADYIFPYKKLLQKDLVNDLVIFYMTPNRQHMIEPSRKPKPTCGSVLIGSRQFAIF